MEFKKEDYLKLYRSMVLGRKFDEAIVDCVMKGKIRGFHHEGIGEEGIAAGAIALLRPDDFYILYHRGYAHAIGKGLNMPAMVAEMFGRKNGYSRGKGGPIHQCDLSLGTIGVPGALGGVFVLSAGMGIAAQMNGRGQVVACLFGDGASNRGSLHEAFNMSMLWKLPIVWICYNNGWAMSMRTENQVATRDVAALASGYDMPAVVVDGCDVLAVAEAVTEGVERARTGAGPCMVECKAYRIKGHSMGDQGTYRSAEEIEAAWQREPIKRYRAQLLQMEILTEEDMARLDREYDAEVAAAIQFAENGPMPDAEDAMLDVYAE